MTASLSLRTNICLQTWWKGPKYFQLFDISDKCPHCCDEPEVVELFADDAGEGGSNLKIINNSLSQWWFKICDEVVIDQIK